jgi:hypothetical protein
MYNAPQKLDSKTATNKVDKFALHLAIKNEYEPFTIITQCRFQKQGNARGAEKASHVRLCKNVDGKKNKYWLSIICLLSFTNFWSFCTV